MTNNNSENFAAKGNKQTNTKNEKEGEVKRSFLLGKRNDRRMGNDDEREERLARVDHSR